MCCLYVFMRFFFIHLYVMLCFGLIYWCCFFIPIAKTFQIGSRRQLTGLFQYPARSIPLFLTNDKQHLLDVNEYGDQFNEWEEEEIALANQDKVRIKMEEEDEDKEEWPDYMKKLLKYKKHHFTDLDEELVPASKLPIIAIIGRPNTGKSTLANRITESYRDGAIVHDEPGITRDRVYRFAEWNGYNFQVVDTGGILFDDKEDIFAAQIKQQAFQALHEADVAILVCDGKQGVLPMDEELAQWLRRNLHIPLFLAVSKCESTTKGQLQAQEFWSLGLNLPYPVSGIHGNGVGDLLDVITEKHLTKVSVFLKENATNVAIIGRPNVGKSSLFNRLYGSERAIVSDVAGTTRDAIDALITSPENQNITYRIIDTAGIRKKNKIQYGPEFFMINRAFKAIRRSEVVIFVVDATQGIVEQDRILAERIAQDGRACIIALNKWDAIEQKNDKSYLKATENLRTMLSTLAYAPIVLTSAKTGQRVQSLWPIIASCQTQFHRRIPTGVLNEIMNDAVTWQTPPVVQGKQGRIYYSIQVSTAPPTIVLFVNDGDLFTDTYQKYIEKQIRKNLAFEGTPIKFIWRGKTLRSVTRKVKESPEYQQFQQVHGQEASNNNKKKDSRGSSLNHKDKDSDDDDQASQQQHQRQLQQQQQDQREQYEDFVQQRKDGGGKKNNKVFSGKGRLKPLSRI